MYDDGSVQIFWPLNKLITPFKKSWWSSLLSVWEAIVNTWNNGRVVAKRIITPVLKSNFQKNNKWLVSII